jgi:hypothetical protein
VETVNTAISLKRAVDEEVAAQAGVGARIKNLGRRVAGGFDRIRLKAAALVGRGGGAGGGDADVDPKVMLEDLNQQARRCVRVVGLFREASLVLDEVDLILHPL